MIQIIILRLEAQKQLHLLHLLFLSHKYLIDGEAVTGHIINWLHIAKLIGNYDPWVSCCPSG